MTPVWEKICSFTICMCASVIFGAEGEMWVMIVLAPNHCLLLYFASSFSLLSLPLAIKIFGKSIYNRLSLSRLRLSRITAYLEKTTTSCPSFNVEI